MENFQALGAMFIREARKSSGLTQAELAERANVSQAYIANLESGKVSPTLETIMKYLHVMDFDLHCELIPLDDSDFRLARPLATPHENWTWHSNTVKSFNKLRNAVIVHES